MRANSWRLVLALRDALEIIAVLAFIVLVPPLLERTFVQYGLSTTGGSRIVATALIFILWAAFGALLLILNREPFSNVGLNRPQDISRTVLCGFLTAAAIFVAVVTLETLGFGKDRLGDIGQELKANVALIIQRMAVSILIVGFVEEFVFRGFILSRLAAIFGRSRLAWSLALLGQAALFGLSHGYQQIYGMILTGAIGLFLGIVYMITGRNLWVVVIGHGFYDSAHAAFIGLSR